MITEIKRASFEYVIMRLYFVIGHSTINSSTLSNSGIVVVLLFMLKVIVVTVVLIPIKWTIVTTTVFIFTMSNSTGNDAGNTGNIITGASNINIYTYVYFDDDDIGDTGSVINRTLERLNMYKI